jgi:hypothetical protein
LQVIYPPNKQISALNVERLLELADEYQIIELNKRCRMFLMQQRGIYCLLKTNKKNNLLYLKGSIEILLLAQRFQFDDVLKRCADHLKHTLNTNVLMNDIKVKEIKCETMNSILLARVKHLETIMEAFKRKLSSACEKFREIKSLPGYNDTISHCTRHTETSESCQECMRNVRLIINKLCEEGNDLVE